MDIVNTTKLTTVREELNALASLIEYDPPYTLILDVLANSIMLIGEVIDCGVEERNLAVEPIMSAENIINAANLFANILKT